MTMKSATLKPKIKQNKDLERIDIEIEFNNEGHDMREKYLVIYREFPNLYRIYPVCGGSELAKGETNTILKYYMSRFIKDRAGDYKEMTLAPVISSGINNYKEV
jgi:hypothetical protein